MTMCISQVGLSSLLFFFPLLKSTRNFFICRKILYHLINFQLLVRGGFFQTEDDGSENSIGDVVSKDDKAEEDETKTTTIDPIMQVKDRA